MEMVLSASAKRSLSKALKKHLPEYMIPNTFVTLLQFPMTFSGKIDLKALPPPQDFEQLLQKEHIQPKTKTEEIITAIWDKLLDKHDISMSDNFFDLGGNSLKAAELSINLLNQFHISIPVNILFDLSYIPCLPSILIAKARILAPSPRHNKRLNATKSCLTILYRPALSASTSKSLSIYY